MVMRIPGLPGVMAPVVRVRIAVVQGTTYMLAFQPPNWVDQREVLEQGYAIDVGGQAVRTVEVEQLLEAQLALVAFLGSQACSVEFC